MANGLYEGDGGVSFGQEQFEEKRKREEKERKKQQKIQENLYRINLAAAGANWLINQDAEKIEREGAVARSHYLAKNETAKEWNTMHKEYEKLGYTRQQMLEAETRNNLRNHLLSIYGEEFNVDGFSDAINEISKNYSKDPNNLSTWNKTVDAQLAIPNLTHEDMIELIRAEGEAPKTLGAWFGNKVLKIAKSHDKETLTEEDRLAKQKLLSGLIGDQFKNATSALEAYGKLGNPIEELTEFMKSEEGKKITAYKNANVSTFENVVEDKYGGKSKVTFATTIAQAPDGSPVQIGNAIPMGSYTITGERKVRNPTELKTGQDDIIAYIKRANDVDLESFYKDEFKDNPVSYTNNILDTAENLINTQGLSKPQAIAAATEYVSGQDSLIIDTNMSLFDLDNMQGAVDTNKLPQYIESIKQVKPEYGVEQELRTMRDQFLLAIKESELDDQQKEEEEIALNSIMKNAGIIPAKDYNNLVINEGNESPEVKTWLQEINEIPYIGKVSDFLVGDELDLYDASWLVPGYGLYKIGGKVASKTLIPKLADNIIKSKTGQASINKIRKRMMEGFSNTADKDNFVKGLTVIEKAIFRAMSKSEKSVSTPMLQIFRKEIAELPGLYLKAYLPSLKQTVGWGLFGGLSAYGFYSKATLPEKKEIED